MATDALVQKHQAISIHSTNQVIIVLDQFQTKNALTVKNGGNKNVFRKENNHPAV